MLELRIDNKALELQDNASVTITLSNPSLDPEQISRAYSYPFKLQHSPVNMRAFQHSYRLDSAAGVQRYKARLKLQGLTFLAGFAKLEEHTHRRSEIVFQNDNLDSLAKFDEINIRDIVGTVNIPQPTTATVVFIPFDGVSTYTLIINDVNYSGTTSSGGVGGNLDDAMIELRGAINADYPSAASWDSFNNRFTLTYTENWQIENSLGAIESQTTFAEAREANIQTFIASLQVTPRQDVCFPVLYNDEAYNRTQNPRWRGYYNWILDQNGYNNPHYEDPFFQVSYKPLVRLRYVLDQIAAASGLDDIVFDVPNSYVADLENLLIWYSYAPDEVILEQLLDSVTERYKLAPPAQIKISNHLPDYTAKELLIRLTKFFNLHMEVKDNKLFFRRNLDQTAHAIADWTAYTQPGYERTAAENTGVTIQYEPDIDEPFLTQGDAYVIADGSNEITLPARPVYYRDLNNNLASPASQWRVGTMQQQTTSPAYDTQNENETLRLLFDNGFHTDDEGRSYHRVTPLGDNFSLLLTSESNSLYAEWWQGWTRFLFSPIITRVINIPIGELLKLRRWENTLVKITDPNGESIALIRRVRFRVNTRAIAPAEVELQKRL